MEQRIDLGEHGTSVLGSNADCEGAAPGIYQILEALICFGADLQNLPG